MTPEELARYQADIKRTWATYHLATINRRRAAQIAADEGMTLAQIAGCLGVSKGMAQKLVERR